MNKWESPLVYEESQPAGESCGVGGSSVVPMRSKHARAAICAAALVAIGFSRIVWAQTYEVLHAFTVPATLPVAGLVEGTDGFFYGTTRGGGASAGGTVFKIDSAGNLTTLHTFWYPDGVDPEAGLIQASDGKFYGTTYTGGAYGFGTVFRIDSAGSFAVLHSFAGAGATGDGSYPLAGLIQATDGNFYGTTSNGGLAYSDLGTVFKMTPAGVVTILHSFGGSDGIYPAAGLVQSTADGKLYGTTQVGGSGSGTVFKIDTAGTNFTTLHSFVITDGARPSAALIQANGRFYGTTPTGSGANVDGNVFSIDSAGSFAVVKSFGASDGHGAAASLVLGTDGNLYGTTYSGGANDLGTVFRINFAGNLTTLHPFTGGDGAHPVANVVQGTDGNFYGTTRDGGTLGSGTVFKMIPSGTLTTLQNFGGTSTGYEPEASVVQASDGNLYGTTFWGGPGNNGTIYKLTLAGTRTVVHNFTETDGAQPWAKLVQLAAGGPLYGTTSRGGSSHWGAAFSITLAGAYSFLHSFNGTDGLGPRDSALVQRAADGMLYGLTEQGGTGYGNAFKMDTSGNVTSLHSFTISDGVYPSNGLLLASDGNFYGTTSTGGTGANPQGTVFKMTPSGTVTTLHQFNHVQGVDDDGMWPVGGLIQATDGKFYGTTRVGGANTVGNIFRIDSAGNYDTIHSFAGSDGSEPYGNLLQGSDGKLYGTTFRGGPNDAGTIFSIDTTGANFTMMHALTGEDGSGPVGTLIQASDGKLYGTTVAGGPGKSGVVFRVTLFSCTPPPPPVASSNSPICAGQTLQLTASTVAGATYSWTGPNGFTSSLQNPSIPNATAAASGTYSVTVTVGGCTSSPAMTTATVNALPSATITAPSSVCPNSSGFSAFVPDAGPGATYSWSITNGTITGGAGTRTITFSVGTASPVGLSVTVTSSQGCSSNGSASITVGGACAQSFYALTPCRVLDTRKPNGPYGGPSLAAGGNRTFVFAGQCAIPSSAKAVSVNVVAVNPTAGPGFLTLYPGGTTRPTVSTINYKAGKVRANNAIITLGAAKDITAYCGQGSGTADIVVDVNGYFQ